MEVDAAGEAVGGDVVLEDGADVGQIEADAGDVGVGERDLGDEVALRGADVDGGFVLAQGNFCAMAMLEPRLIPVMALRKLRSRSGSA